MNTPQFEQETYDTEWDGPSLEQEEPALEHDAELTNGAKRCSCGAVLPEYEYEDEDEGELSRAIPVLKKLYDAGRLGWRAGRWIDKKSGRVFGKSISQRGAELLYYIFGRSKRAEDFVDNLPPPIRKWLYSL